VIHSRAPSWLGDPGPTISVLVSLVYEAESRLDDAVADARDHGYSWDQIADRLGTSVTTARRRYVWWTHHRHELLAPAGQPAPPATKTATSPPRTPATPRPARPARQLNITPATARRHHRAHIASTPAAVD
jgi:transposase-like protein